MAKKEKAADKIKTITVTQSDFTKLSQLILNFRDDKSVDFEYLRFLGIELQKSVRVDSKLITPDFVTMNSVVNVLFIDSKRQMEMHLVYPEEANLSKGLISVLSPLGCALLGYKAGDEVSFKAPKGEQLVRIESVTYQPEANGKDLL